MKSLSLRSPRIVHLLDFPDQVVDVVDRCGLRISLRCEAVQRVVKESDGLALAVGLAGEVVVGVVLVVLAELRMGNWLRHTAKGVVGERRRERCLVATRMLSTHI
jgi:hypothetical protein